MTGTFPSDDHVRPTFLADSLSDDGQQSLIHWQRGGATTRNTRGVGWHPVMVEPRYLLPPDAYRSQDWFARERALLFPPRWSLVADEAQLAEPGAFVAASVGDAPLV